MYDYNMLRNFFKECLEKVSWLEEERKEEEEEEKWDVVGGL
jgi:hypothetical protein